MRVCVSSSFPHMYTCMYVFYILRVCVKQQQFRTHTSPAKYIDGQQLSLSRQLGPSLLHTCAYLSRFIHKSSMLRVFSGGLKYMGVASVGNMCAKERASRA